MLIQLIDRSLELVSEIYIGRDNSLPSMLLLHELPERVIAFSICNVGRLVCLSERAVTPMARHAGPDPAALRSVSMLVCKVMCMAHDHCL